MGAYAFGLVPHAGLEAASGVCVERCHEVEATARASGVEPAQLEDGMYTVFAKRLLVGGRWQ